MNKSLEVGPSLEGFIDYLFSNPAGYVLALTGLVLVCILFADWSSRRL